MKKTLTLMMGKTVSLLSLVVAVVCSMMPVMASAADASDVPGISMFYPGKSDSPQEYKPNADAYIYFVTGAKVSEAKGRVVQNDVELGTIVYAGSTDVFGNPTSTCRMKAKDERNAQALDGIQAGVFDIEIFEVTYVVDGIEKTYSDVANPLDVVTYFRNIPNAVIVNEVGFEDHTIRSYYPADSNEGTKTWYFDKPIKPEGVTASFQYGQGNTYILTAIDCTVAQDGMSVTVDIRGHCYSNDVLAPGVTWVDDFGNPIPDPTEITIIIDNLHCVDGSRVGYQAVSLDGAHTAYIEAQIWENFHYLDLTFPNPRISLVQFFDHNNPYNKYAAMSDITDMMAVTINNSEFIASADITLSYGGVSQTIAYGDIQKSDKIWTVAIPQAIRDLGSDKLVVSLDNVVFTKYDGMDHVISPYTFSDVTKEVLSIADLKNQAEGTDIVLNTVDGIKVTLSNELGYTFAEDASGAIQIMTEDYKMVLNQGTTVVGKLYGQYLGYGMFMIKPNLSDYTESVADVNVGQMIESLQAFIDPANSDRLVTVLASDDMPITYDEASGYYVIAGSVPVMTDFIEDFDFTGAVENVTGVIYTDPNLNQSYLLVRGQYDFNKDLGQGENEDPGEGEDPGEEEDPGDVEDPGDDITNVDTVASLKLLEEGQNAVVNLTDAVVTYIDEFMNTFIIEDATGALVVYEGTNTPLFTLGYKVTVKMTGTYYGSSIFSASADDFELISAEEVDITYGTEIDLENISDPSNDYRLVTYKNSEETPLVSISYAVNVGTKAQVVDYYGVLDDEYNFPVEVESVTGIILPTPDLAAADDDDEVIDFDAPTRTLIAVRSINDIVAHTTGIETISADTQTAAPVYNISGIKVREAGQPVDGLTPGIYISGGKKQIIK